MNIRYYVQAATEPVRDVLGSICWSFEMTLALSPIGRWAAARNPHIRDMRIFGAACILEFERGK